VYSQLPYVAATCKHPFPTGSAALFSVSATYSSGFLPAFFASWPKSAIVSSRREVLFRRHASRTSSRGEAPCVNGFVRFHLVQANDTGIRTSSAISEIGLEIITNGEAP
jgi:hypothetical protein